MLKKYDLHNYMGKKDIYQFKFLPGINQMSINMYMYYFLLRYFHTKINLVFCNMKKIQYE